MVNEQRSRHRRWLIGLGILAALSGAYLLLGDKPWDAEKIIAEREAAGRKARTEQFVAIGCWWSALVNLVIVLILIPGIRLWSRPLPEPANTRMPSPARFGRWFLVVLGAIAVLAGALRWNLATRSLWWDELWTAKFAVVGYYLGEPDQPLEDRYFGHSTWKRALWLYTKPTNHPVASVPARVSHMVWRQISDPELPHEFSDTALRLPTFLVSIGSVLAVGFLGILWNRRWIGIAAALLLAIHPWHVRYGIDVRAYSYLVFWAVTGCICLTGLFRQGGSGWGWWAAFGLNQFLIVWSFPVAVLLAAGFFGAAFILVLMSWKDRKSRLTALGRLFLVNLFAGMLWLQLFSPNLLQVAEFAQAESERHAGHAIDFRIIRDLGSQLATGLPYQWGRSPATEGLPDLASRAGNRVVGQVGVGLIVFALIAGTIGMIRRKRYGPLLILAGVVAAALLTMILFKVTGAYFYTRFLVFLLVPFVWLLASSGEAFSRASIRKSVPFAMVALFAWFAIPQLRVLNVRPYEPLRDLAEFGESGRSEETGFVFAGYGHGIETLPLYFPGLRTAYSKAELQSLIEENGKTGGRLLVATGHELFNRHMVPDGFELLDDEARFKPVAAFAGIEPQYFYRVLEYQGR